MSLYMRSAGYILLCCLLLTSACKKKKTDTPQSDLKEIPLITGIQYKDLNSHNSGSKGYPNAKTGTPFVSDNYILAYPNPCMNQFTLHIHKMQDAPVNVRLTLGEYREEQTSTEFVLAGEIFVPIDTQYNLGAGNVTFIVNTENVAGGHYRLNVEYDTVKLYDHIWIDKP